ncbi:DUF4144 domain-containing protein [Vibrio sp. Isolate24]|uniref:DUF4144 domain-containing protein n=1 Tax=Vibrio sp. Isolate24 TaxID=2908534 RepID=UPI001EFCEA62|nr:DUF4144 domain-containing protein [Vibrio sp. Isolate24]MCG9676727.1 DUF4144 domain-containing protein [Vibrio sp. Isolate24]
MIDTINHENNEIQWPAFLKLEGDNELVYLASQDMLFRELESLILDTNDLVIDSAGRCFQLASDSETIGLNMTPKTYDLTEITDLIQAHAFSKAQVCIIKIQFDSIHAAIDSLRDQ